MADCVQFAHHPNAFCESLIGHFKAECLNHFVCFNLEQLNYIVGKFLRYYNEFCPHQGKGIDNRILDSNWQPPPPVGKVKRQRILGGLLNHYYRDAG